MTRSVVKVRYVGGGGHRSKRREDDGKFTCFAYLSLAWAIYVFFCFFLVSPLGGWDERRQDNPDASDPGRPVGSVPESWQLGVGIFFGAARLFLLLSVWGKSIRTSIRVPYPSWCI